MARIYQRGATWYVDYADAKGNRIREKVGPDKRRAQATLIDREAREERKRTGLSPMLDNAMTINTLREKFKTLYFPKLRPGARRRMTYALDCILSRLPGVKIVADLTPEVLEGYITERRREKSARGREVSPRSVAIEVATLHRLLNWAVALQLIDNNPVRSVKPPPRVRVAARRALSAEEQAALLAASPDRFRDIWVVFLRTGIQPF